MQAAKDKLCKLGQSCKIGKQALEDLQEFCQFIILHFYMLCHYFSQATSMMLGLTIGVLGYCVRMLAVATSFTSGAIQGHA